MKLGAPPDSYSRADQAQMRGQLEREDARNLKRGNPQDALYLTATDTGETLKGTVTSAGVLTWTVISRT